MTWLLIVYLLGVVAHVILFATTNETGRYSFETVAFCSVFYPLILAIFILIAICSLIIFVLHTAIECVNRLKEKVTNRE